MLFKIKKLRIVFIFAVAALFGLVRFQLQSRSSCDSKCLTPSDIQDIKETISLLRETQKNLLQRVEHSESQSSTKWNLMNSKINSIEAKSKKWYMNQIEKMATVVPHLHKSSKRNVPKTRGPISMELEPREQKLVNNDSGIPFSRVLDTVEHRRELQPFPKHLTEKKCDQFPLLSPYNHLNNFIYDERVHRILYSIYALTAIENLNDFFSNQYRAACWILFDDDSFIQPDDEFLAQRFVLAVFLFTQNKHANKLYTLPKHTCDFDLVKCSSEGHITELIIDNENFQTSIPSEFAHLRFLEVLDLQNNRLYGTIPTEIGMMVNLRKIQVNNNVISGSIPSEIALLSNLTELRLDVNNLSGNIPSEIGSLNILEHLALPQNLLTGIIPVQLYRCTNLKTLELFNNILTGTISTLLGEVRKLKLLDLSDNMFSGPIPSEIGMLTTMTEIWLQRNTLSGAIPVELGNIKDISRFVLNNNKLRGSIPDIFNNYVRPGVINLSVNNLTGRIPQSLFTTGIKIALFLDFNQLTGYVPKDFCSSLKIQRFDTSPWFLDTPKVDCQCCDHVNCHLWRIDKKISGGTVRPHCPSNNIATFNIEERYWLSDMISDVTYQEDVGKEVQLSRSFCLSPTGCYTFNDTIEFEADYSLGYNPFSKSLEVQDSCGIVDVCGHMFDRFHPKREGLNQITQLAFPDLSINETLPRYKALCWIMNDDPIFNNFDVCDGTLLQRFVMALFYYSYESIFEIGNITNHTCDWPGVTCESNKKFVEGLYFPSSNMSGTIIPELSLLSRLKEVNFTDNELDGSIDPSLFASLPFLEVYDIGKNNLGGDIPEELFLAPNLRKLNVSRNLLVGTLPSLISYPENLQLFDIGNNLLHGKIPEELILCRNLELIDISKNNLAFHISPGLGDLHNLKTIRFNENKLSGSIPPDIFDAKGIEELMLFSNALTGSIPTQIGTLSNVTKIALSHNALKGKIPSEFGRLERVELLQLHQNRLIGLAPLMANSRIDREMENAYVTDCGQPSFLLGVEVHCISCTMCCNSVNMCQKNILKKVPVKVEGYLYVGFLIPVFLTGMFFLFIYQGQRYGYLFRATQKKKVPIPTEDSVYCLIFSEDPWAWLIFILIAIIQSALFGLFMDSSDLHNKSTDWSFTVRCPENSVHCTEEKTINLFGWIMFYTVTLVFLGPDIFDSILQVRISIMFWNSRFLFSGFVRVFLAMLALYTSIIYNRALAETNSDLIMNAVILLFINDLDEQFLSILNIAVPTWVEDCQCEVKEFIDRLNEESKDDIDINEISTMSEKVSTNISSDIQGRPENPHSDNLVEI